MPSPKTPLCAIGLVNVVRPILEAEGFGALCGLVIGGNEDVSMPMVEDPRLPLISFTGSTAIGKLVAAKVGGRFGKGIFECGGNNALIVMEDADLDMVLPATVFGSVGTAGQRCGMTPFGSPVLMRVGLIKRVPAQFAASCGHVD